MQIIIFLMLATIVSSNHVSGQKAEPDLSAVKDGTALQTIIGEVTAIEPPLKQMQVIKSDGNTVTLLFTENTVFSKVAPGAQTLQGAVKTSPSEINKGDRVYARGIFTGGGQPVVAVRSVIVMAQTEILQKRERERNEWQKRSVAGKVTAISPATKEITLLVSTREAAKSITVEAGSPTLRFRRYAPDSVKFENTTPSSFSELKVGDQMRSLGELSADGTRFKSEEIVSGSFRTLGGSITAVNNQTNEITIKVLNLEKPLVVTVSENSMMRRVLPEVASAIVSQVISNAAAAKTTKAVSSTGSSARDSAVKNSGDLQEGIENSPELKLAELKTGDMVLVTVENTIQSAPVKAAVLLSGVESVLSLFKPQRNAKDAVRTNLNTGLPLDALNGIGVQ